MFGILAFKKNGSSKLLLIKFLPIDESTNVFNSNELKKRVKKQKLDYSNLLPD